jgi:hypothetical protein
MDHHPNIDSRTLDGVAISISAVCVLHCLLAPLAVLAFPIIGSSLWASHEFHAWLLVLILPSSTLALYLGCREHGSGKVLGLGLTGMAVLIAAAVLGPEVLTELGEVLVTGVGGTLLAVSHVLNFRRCRALRCEERACAEHAAA